MESLERWSAIMKRVPSSGGAPAERHLRRMANGSARDAEWMLDEEGGGAQLYTQVAPPPVETRHFRGRRARCFHSAVRHRRRPFGTRRASESSLPLPSQRPRAPSVFLLLQLQCYSFKKTLKCLNPGARNYYVTQYSL
eukprot:scaffold84690_cov30-Tisochrysis_lutea.AAC.1